MWFQRARVWPWGCGVPPQMAIRLIHSLPSGSGLKGISSGRPFLPCLAKPVALGAGEHNPGVQRLRAEIVYR